jgi:hypothetical protein
MAQKSSTKSGAKKATKSAAKKSAAPKKEKATKSGAKKAASSTKAPAKKAATKAAKAAAKTPVKEKEPAKSAKATEPERAAKSKAEPKPAKKPEPKPEPKASAPEPKPAAAPEPAKDPFSEPPPASDEGRTVDDYIGRLSGWQSMVAKMLRRSIKRAAPDSTEVIKWSQPVYEENGPFAYFRVQGKQIQLGFWRGVDLFDEHKLLEGEGETMRHLWIRRPEDMKPQYIEALVRQAAGLNRKPEEPSDS